MYLLIIIPLNQSIHHSFIVLSLFYDTKYNANEVIPLEQAPKVKGKGVKYIKKKRKQNKTVISVARLKMQTSCMRLPEGISSFGKGKMTLSKNKQK